MFAGSVGSFMVQVTIGISKPVIGDDTKGRLDLMNLSVTGFAPGTLHIQLTDTDYSLVSSPSPTAKFTGSIDGFTPGAVSFEGRFRRAAKLSGARSSSSYQATFPPSGRFQVPWMIRTRSRISSSLPSPSGSVFEEPRSRREPNRDRLDSGRAAT